VRLPTLVVNVRSPIAAGLLAIVLAVGPTSASARGEAIKVVAAESVYGDIALQIGGEEVAVTSILASSSQDPHAFEPGAVTARAIADSQLLIYNGAGYDPWVVKLLSAAKSPSREVIEVARIAGKPAGANPHLWYDTVTMSALAAAIGTALTRLDPAYRDAYAARLAAFVSSMQDLRAKIAALRVKYAGAPVTATEPVFDYMAAALGLAMRNERFQLAVMNGTEPSASSVAAFEADLRTHAVKVLLYNTQTSQALAEHMRSLAERSGVPVVSIAENKPETQSYQAWMASQLDALERALGGR
jgi:zinc/manganese transport system substrate-binding protein